MLIGQEKSKLQNARLLKGSVITFLKGFLVLLPPLYYKGKIRKRRFVRRESSTWTFAELNKNVF